MNQNQIAARLKNILRLVPKPHKPSKDNLILLIISFFLAVFLWAYLVSNIVADYSPSFTNIRVISNLSNTKAADFRLQLLKESQQALENLTVNCTIRGNRADIGGLKRSQLEAYVDYDSALNVSGVQDLPIRIRTTEGREFDNVTVSPDSVALNLDYFDTKTIRVLNENVSYNYLQVGQDVHVDKENITVDPQTVQISGPKSQLDTIDHINIQIADSTGLVRTTTFSDVMGCQLMNSSNTEIPDNPDITVQTQRFSVTVPVYYTKTLPLTLNIKPVPDGFPKDEVMKRIRLVTNDIYTLPGYSDEPNPLMIELKMTDPEKKAALDEFENYEGFACQLSQLSPNPDKPLQFTFNPGEDYEDLTNIGKVMVTLDGEDLTTKTLLIKNSDIKPKMEKPGYVCEMKVPTGNTRVTLVGTEAQLAEINEEDLQVGVNYLTADPGNNTLRLEVELPEDPTGKRFVWISPDPTVDVIVYKKQE